MLPTHPNANEKRQYKNPKEFQGVAIPPQKLEPSPSEDDQKGKCHEAPPPTNRCDQEQIERKKQDLPPKHVDRLESCCNEDRREGAQGTHNPGKGDTKRHRPYRLEVHLCWINVHVDSVSGRRFPSRLERRSADRPPLAKWDARSHPRRRTTSTQARTAARSPPRIGGGPRGSAPPESPFENHSKSLMKCILPHFMGVLH